MHSFLGLIALGTCPFQHRATPTPNNVLGLGHCFRLKSGRGSKAARRLGDSLQKEWGLRLCQSWGGESPSPPFSIVPRVLPWGSLCDHACLRSSLLWGILPILANRLSARGQAGWCERGQRRCPCKEDKLCSSKWLLVPRSFYSALDMRGYSFWNQAGRFPTHSYYIKWQSWDSNPIVYKCKLSNKISVIIY